MIKGWVAVVVALPFLNLKTMNEEIDKILIKVSLGVLAIFLVLYTATLLYSDFF